MVQIREERKVGSSDRINWVSTTCKSKAGRFISQLQTNRRKQFGVTNLVVMERKNAACAAATESSSAEAHRMKYMPLTKNNDVFTYIMGFLTIEEIIACEESCSMMRNLAYLGYRCRAKDPDNLVYTFKHRYRDVDGQNVLLTKKELCLYCLRQVNTNPLLLIGGAFGSERMLGALLETIPVKRTESLPVQPILHSKDGIVRNAADRNTNKNISTAAGIDSLRLKIRSSEVMYRNANISLGACASVMNSFGQMEFFGGWDDEKEEGSDMVSSLHIKDFMVPQAAVDKHTEELQSLLQAAELANTDSSPLSLTNRGRSSISFDAPWERTDALGRAAASAVFKNTARVFGDSRLGIAEQRENYAIHGRAIENKYLKMRCKHWRQMVPLPVKLSYASAVCLIDGTTVVIGGGLGPYRGAAVYKNCYVRRPQFTLLSYETKLQMHEMDDASAEDHCSKAGNHDLQPPRGSTRMLPEKSEVAARIQPSLEACVPRYNCDLITRSNSDKNAIMMPLEKPNIDSDRSPCTRHHVEAVDDDDDDDDDDGWEDVSGEEEGEELDDEGKEGEEEASWKLKISASVWDKNLIPPLHTARCGHVSVSTFNDSIVVAGGYAGGTAYLSSAEIYIPGAASWQELPNMQARRSGAAACLSPDGAIIVAGGSPDGSSAHKSVERFDLRTGKWEHLAPMTRPRSYTAGCLGRDGLFYVTGGIKNIHYEFDDSMDVYDFRADKWIPAMIGSLELESDGGGNIMETNQDYGYYPQNACLARASHHMFSLPAQPVTVLHDYL